MPRVSLCGRDKRTLLLYNSTACDVCARYGLDRSTLNFTWAYLISLFIHSSRLDFSRVLGHAGVLSAHSRGG